MGRKPESSRLNVVYILYVLSNYSDEEHPMGISDIKEKVDKEFGSLSPDGEIISADTVKRTLEELIDKLFPMKLYQEETEFRFGYYLYCVMKQGETYVPYDAPEGKQVPNKYYYYESSFKLAELLTMKDAVETYNYFSREDITDIIQKLVKLRPRSFPKHKYYDLAGSQRDENSLLLMNIEELYRIIQNGNRAQVTYCFYDREKKLAPRPGYPKIIEPVHLMWSNGYYYLLAYNEKYDTIINMRVDRITDIEEVQEERTHKPEKLNPVSYRHEHPVMFGGEKEKIVLLCRDTGKNYIMNVIVDVFGKDARVLAAQEELKAQYLKENEAQEPDTVWLKVTVESTLGGVELWATQYCTDCVVVAPEKLRKRVQERLQQGNQYYQ
ncbi:MAG: WYL domain-containing protein [Lachnospiraceae bacterium]|jgi:predicted DNA-binding transcriptional regulator YafY|nr:WYL domain-containing protein [Lachnospiraceae bacterium]